MLRPWVIVLFVLGGVAPARAQQASPVVVDDEAKRLYGVGTERFDARDFLAAAEAFQRAYDLSKRKELLYNIGVCHRELGQLEPALDSFRQYLAFSGPSGQNADAVRQQIADLERLVPAHLEVRSRTKAATITLDGQLRGVTPLVTDVATGSHVLVAEGMGPEERLSLSLAAGERRLVEVGHKGRTGLWVGIGVGAAVIVAGVIVGAVLGTRPAELHPGTLDPQIVNVK